MSNIGLKITFWLGLILLAVSALNLFYPSAGYYFYQLFIQGPAATNFDKGYEFTLYVRDKYISSTIYGVMGLVLAGASYYQIQKDKNKD